MRDKPFVFSRFGLRGALLAATALALTGCADSSRLSDPFSNPFGPSANADRSPTGSIPAPRHVASSPRIVGEPLPAPGVVAPTGVASAPYTPAPVASAAAPSGSSSNWTAQGGTPVVLAQGESIGVLSDRYGVPADAIVRANGFSSAAQVHPGTRVVIPVYSVGAGRVAAQARKPEPAPVVVAAAPIAPRHETLKLVKGPAPAKMAARDQDDDDARTSRKPAKSGKADSAPPISAKAKLLERAKIAKASTRDEDADDNLASPKAAAAKPVSAKVERAKVETVKPEKVAVAKPEKIVAAKQAIVREEASKPERSIKFTKLETPVAEKAPAIDPKPTASLPPADAAKGAAKTADVASPEFRWPARGRVIQGFKAGGNDGINIAVPEGTPVKAAEEGVVAYAGSELKGYGNLVLIRHPNGFVSAYANNGSLDVKRGESVKRGQTIAKSGQSGNVSSPQLHFELRKGAQPVDPSSYLAGL